MATFIALHMYESMGFGWHVSSGVLLYSFHYEVFIASVGPDDESPALVAVGIYLIIFFFS